MTESTANPGANPGPNLGGGMPASPARPTKLGILLWNQATDWASYESAAVRVDRLGYDSLWAWDHLYAIFGDPYQPIFEGYTSLAAWAKVTSNVKLGLLVGANTFRNPGVVAKMLTTIDHASDGRAIAGLGGAWMDLEHEANGIDFGTGFGQRLDWLEESTAALRALFAGETVTSEPGGRYQFKDLRLLPLPIQSRLPIMIGGSGEKKTLRTVARHADMWNAMGTREFLEHKIDVLRRHCDDAGRDIAEIEFTGGCKPVIRSTAEMALRVWEQQMEHNRTPLSEVIDDDTFWVGTPEMIAEKMADAKALGFHTFLAELAAPYDDETIERWITEVRPMVDGASPATGS
jgi:alkanesulfonate monooxygenase SsuD/methylene tetrahydromethanopterin reductase-like flavin-dependent oxidoreductase (luciferase family)